MNQAKGTNGNRHWHVLEREELLRTLETSADQGLSSQEAERRLQALGPNQLEDAKPVTLWQMIWEQLNSFVVYLLIIASAISAVLGDYLEAGVILAIVVLNTILGVVQERLGRMICKWTQTSAVSRSKYNNIHFDLQIVGGTEVIPSRGYH